MREGLRSTLFVLREAWRISPRASIIGFLEALMAVLQGAHPLLYAMIVTGIASGRSTWATTGGILLGASVGFSMLITFWGMKGRIGLMQALAARFEGRTAQLLASLPTLRHLEDPELLDDMQALKDNGGAVGYGYNAVMNALRWILTPVTGIIIALGADWRLGLLLLAGIPQLLILPRTNRMAKEAERAGAQHSRRARALLGMTADRSAASEARALGARPFLRTKLHDAASDALAPAVSATARTQGLTLAVSALYMLAAGAVIAWIGGDVLDGTASLGALTIAITSVTALQGAFAGIREALANLQFSQRAVSRFLRLDRTLAAERASHHGTLRPPDRLIHGIRLRGATFTRPGSSHAVISEMDLDLPAGSTIALVGENGAGKSTLVDLLLGLHDLDSGSIEIDGIPLTDIDLDLWRERCAGAFQDHARLETTAQHAIGTGDLPRLDSPAAARTALEDASAEDVLTALPAGLATQLGTSWTDGVGLSGGQWQRLAIARGMMRTVPLLRVLDEPTAALDPATEDALFSRYAEAARRGREEGGITLLVTHRFSTVAAADHVVVMDAGKIIEQGTHRELMAAGGRYFELYSLQARGYA